MKRSRQQQTERIMANEARLNESRKAVDELARALEWYQTVQEDVRELSAYYGSQEWFADKADLAAGKLPDDLKCGVLGEDVAYNLLADAAAMRQTMAAILELDEDMQDPEEDEIFIKEMAEI